MILSISQHSVSLFIKDSGLVLVSVQAFNRLAKAGEEEEKAHYMDVFLVKQFH